MNKINLYTPSLDRAYDTGTYRNLIDDRGAELLYGERKRLSGTIALKESSSRVSGEAGTSGSSDAHKASPSTRYLSEEERLRLKERYSMEYSRCILQL